MAALKRGGRVLVTGASGFVGQILVRQLLDEGFEVVGVGLSNGLLARRSDANLTSVSFDLAAAPWTDTDLAGVVHLAGLAEVGPSFAEPQRYINANSAMVTNLCEPLLARGSTARVVIVSSGAVYGGGHAGPINETAALRFSSPYAVSKALVENQAAYYRERGLDTVVARPFNHVGPGQRLGFIVPDLAQKLRSLSPGTPLQAGNLDAGRDYTDVRDVVAAYISLLESDSLAQGVYNVASGKAHTGWEVLELLTRELAVPQPQVQTNQARALDPSLIVGDATRLLNETGWRRNYELQDSIRDFVKAAREPS